MKFHTLSKRILTKRNLVVALIVIALGIIGVLYYRSTIFSNETLHLEISVPREAALGEEIEYIVTYENNGNFDLEKPKLTFELPEHSLTEDGRRRITKDLPDMNPGDGGSEVFKARLLGKEEEVKTARVWLTYIPHNLSVRYEAEALGSTTIATVPLELTYENLPSQAESGNEIAYTLRYASQVDYPLENMGVRVTPLTGFVVKSSQPSSLDKAEWRLPTLSKGGQGQIVIQGQVLSNAEAEMIFAARIGMWIDGVFVPVKEVTRTMRVFPSKSSSQAAKLEVAQSAVLVEGSHQVTWEVKGSVSDAKDVIVSAALPSNVSLQDFLLPEAEADFFSFNPSTRKISWMIGSLSSGNSRVVSFQVVPSGVGVGATLVGEVTAAGQDQATGVPVQDSAPALSGTFISL